MPAARRRQRPGTAAGVTFMTLEDETGFVNLVLWKRVFDAFAVLAKTRPFLGVTGKLQVEDGVTHIVAESLWAPVLARAATSRGADTGTGRATPGDIAARDTGAPSPAASLRLPSHDFR